MWRYHRTLKWMWIFKCVCVQSRELGVKVCDDCSHIPGAVGQRRGCVFVPQGESEWFWGLRHQQLWHGDYVIWMGLSPGPVVWAWLMLGLIAPIALGPALGILRGPTPILQALLWFHPVSKDSVNRLYRKHSEAKHFSHTYQETFNHAILAIMEVNKLLGTFIILDVAISPLGTP